MATVYIPYHQEVTESILEPHISNFQSQRALTSSIKKMQPLETEETLNITPYYPLNDEQQLHRKLLLNMWRFNMSFRSICSSDFKKLLQQWRGLASSISITSQLQLSCKFIISLSSEKKGPRSPTKGIRKGSNNYGCFC